MSELRSTAPSRQHTIIIWVLMIITAAIFVMVGFSKISQFEQMATSFNGFGLPLWFMIPAGIAPMVGAVGLPMMPIAFLPGLVLMGVTGSAFIAHMPSGNSIGMAISAIVIFVLAAIVTWLRGSNFARTASNIFGN